MFILSLLLLIATPTPEPVVTPDPSQLKQFCFHVIKSIPNICKSKPEEFGNCSKFYKEFCNK